jgi:ribose 5-phosphate isomerase A
MPVPVEILPHAYQSTYKRILNLGAEKCILRMAESGKQGPIVSDNGCFIIDAWFKDIDLPKALEQELNLIPGVIDNGLFAGYASKVYLATDSGIKIF